MRKSTLLTAVLAFCAITASADTKIIYQDNYADEAASKANWADNRSNGAIAFQQTPDGNYMQFNLALNGANFNGTRFYSIWGATPWEDVTLPNTGYTMSFWFNFEQFGNNSSNAAQRNHEIAVINTDEGAIDTYWGDAGAETSYPNYLFKLTQSKDGSAAGEGGYATSVTGTCGFYINNETDLINVAAATWYKLTLTVVGQKVSYEVKSIDETILKSGSYTLADGIDTRAGGILVYGARYQSITNLGLSLQITMESDEDVANLPTVTLNQVKGNDRVYKATFAEGETLHYILPGGSEQTIDYWDAEDEVSGNAGTAMLTCTQSGTLDVWTTKNEAVSPHSTIQVETGWITLVDPVVAISSVSEGIGKTFTISIDNSQVLLTPTVALTYNIKYSDGSTESGEVENGGTLEMTKAGTLTVTANSIPVAGVEQYKRSSVNYENDVEYVVAQDVQYINWDDSHFAGSSAWESGVMSDSNSSHWLGHWMEANKNDIDGNPSQNPVKVYRTSTEDIDLPLYTLVNDEAGVNYANELLPLIPNTARADVAILLEEGIISNQTSYKNLELTFDPKYVTDNQAKPNFIEISWTNNYDRYDKGPGRHGVDIRKTDDTTYSLYRYDTAIHRARVFAYKGFTASINGVKDAADALSNAPIYTIDGVRVQKAAQKGIYIQNGKKFIVR